MALESEPHSTPLGGSNLDALKSESSNNVDLEDGEIDDDDDDNTVLAVSSAPAPTTTTTAAPPAPSTTSGPSTPRTPPGPKSHDGDRRERQDTNLPPWLQRRLGPPSSKKKNKGSWGPPQKNSFVQEEDEDDFAVHLEKVLQAKAREKAKQARLEKTEEEVEEGVEGNSGDEHARKKKKRKRSRDEDGDGDRERDKESKRKRRDADDQEDDMIFVRGASPHHDGPGTPPFRDYEYDRSFDSYGEEEEEFDESPDRGGHGGFLSRGRGRGSKSMRGSGRGRGRSSGPNEGGRGGFASKRGMKRGGARGGPSGKSQQRPGRDRSQNEICIYYMQGKCPKEADECPYSHDAMPRRKMELCKFYNMNCCAKREKCLYMHKDFPCKYFHTGRRCNSGDKCRFSHDQLTDVTRGVLLKHIELAPKEILGEFRRLTREQAIQIIDRAAKMRAEGKNPEGVDLLRIHEEDDYHSDPDRAHTPMPSSPGDIEQNEYDTRKGRGDENRRRENRDSHDRERNRDRHQSDRRDHAERRERKERKRKRRWDNSPDKSPSQLKKLQETLQRELREQEDEDNMPERKPSPRHRESCDDLVIDEDGDKGATNLWASDECSKDGIKSSKLDLTENPIAEKAGDVSGGESGEDSQDTLGVIPSHLPKRQRELFLRIQQQQREAEHNKESKAEESEDDTGAAAEDDWYSSDEEGPRSLTDVLKNLKEGQKDVKEVSRSKGDLDDDSSKSSSTHGDVKLDQPKEQPARRPPLLPTPNILTNLMKNTAIDQLLSTIRYGPTGSAVSNTGTANQTENDSVPVGLASPTSVSAAPSASVAPAVPVRDPRLSRDPRARSSSIVTTSSPSASPSANPLEAPTRVDPRREARLDPRSERRDPRTEARTDTAPASLESLSSPRSDFRQSDPRAARADARRSSDGSTAQQTHSIYDTALSSVVGDTDLRVRSGSDTDFRRPHTHFSSGDMDLRRDLPSVLPNAFPPRDTDLRFRMGHQLESDYAAASQSDMDLRHMVLPFKPAPIHTPATEIDASLSSYTPGPYRVILIDIPKPDFSNLKINPKDSQVRLDPRLRRVFGLSQNESSVSDTPLSPPPSDMAGAAPALMPARADPRRRGSTSTAPRPADPRQSRMAMGSAVGPVCPPTPRVDDFDELRVTDTDLRMQSQFGRQGAPWENFANRGRGGLLPHPDWMPNAAGSFQHHGQPHSFHQQRSFTPPPT